MPDPCDAREAEPDPGFDLPCPCGGFPTAERDRMLQALATAHGHTLAAEHVAWPTTKETPVRIRLTLDINRHRDDPQTPDFRDASNGTTERAEPHPVGFTIDGPRDPEPDEEDDRR